MREMIPVVSIMKTMLIDLSLVPPQAVISNKHAEWFPRAGGQPSQDLC